MAKVAIVYHSGYGHTEVIAKAILKGSSEAGADASVIKISKEGTITDQDWQTLDAADAIMFGSPTYMGGVSGPFKMFADATSKIWFTQGWKDKIAAGFTNSMGYSGDKLSTLTYMVVFASQHGMIWVSNDLKTTGKTEQDVNRLTSYTGMMAQSDNAGPEVTPPVGDIKTAELFGKRIVDATTRWVK